ncbi:MAG: TrmH family RNA methyltransferase [Solirubrobacteraceae bacterium]
MTITSPDNAKLKEIRKLLARRRERDHTRRFVAEGEDLIAAADAAGWTALARLVAAGSGLPGTQVDPTLLARAAGLASGTRALAVYEQRWALSPLGPICVYLHGVGDPGNVGTILRCAEAFGAACVAIGPDTADPFSPKAVRASMGSIFAVPLARAERPSQLPGATIALVANAGRPLGEIFLAGEVTLLIGAEREGLPQELVSQADAIANIPIRTHSLNAAMAAAVALYELTTRITPR